jgi:transposase
MFRAREPQRNLFSARNQYLDLIDPDSFYALLAKHGEQFFWDYKFEDMYFKDNGRPCVPPSAMFNLMMLQMYDNCSDRQAIERSRFDIRWLAVLDLQIGQRLCGKTTLQEFRARVHLSEKTEEQFRAILELAKRLGILKGTRLKVALDTTPILGRGAVKDTYNLIADGIRKLVGVL